MGVYIENNKLVTIREQKNIHFNLPEKVKTI